MHASRPITVLPAPGLGVYTVAEAARLTQTPPATVRAWFRGRSDQAGKGPLLDSDYAVVGDDFALSFLDLIDLLVAGRFRAQGVSIPVIRKSAAALEADLSTKHPFAHAKLFTDGRRVITEAQGRVRDQVLYDVLTRQTIFTELKAQLERIEYDAESLLARRWRVTDGVVVAPAVALGKPVPRHTGVSTAVLVRQLAANGGDVDLVADLYGLTTGEVHAAAEFEQARGLGRAA